MGADALSGTPANLLCVLRPVPPPWALVSVSAQLSDGLALEHPVGTRVIRIFQSLWSEAAVATDALPRLCPSFSSSSSGQFLGEAMGTGDPKGRLKLWRESERVDFT